MNLILNPSVNSITGKFLNDILVFNINKNVILAKKIKKRVYARAFIPARLYFFKKNAIIPKNRYRVIIAISAGTVAGESHGHFETVRFFSKIQVLNDLRVCGECILLK